MPKVIKRDDDPTDVVEYMRNNPKFKACRRRHRWPEDDDDARSTPWTQSYGDPRCTHEIVDKCGRCGMVRRKRAIAVVIKGKFSFTRLPPLYSEVPEGYRVKGAYIYPSLIDEFELEALVMAPKRRKVVPASELQLSRRPRIKS